MRFEYISVQTDNSENAAAFCDIFTDSLITAVVKSSLRKNDSHTSAGFQEVQVTLDKENIFCQPYSAIFRQSFCPAHNEK